MGGEELINGTQRWCLWLKGIEPNELRAMPNIMARVKLVQEWRLTSSTPSVREWSKYPILFTQDRQPSSDYMALPRVSSERRLFIPIGLLSQEVIASDAMLVCNEATVYHLGILSSTMHNAWVRTVAGRLESRYRYASSVYNNYPWPEPNAKQRANIEIAAQGILNARATHLNANLAALYDPLTMPTDLVKAHQKLDKAVDAAYGYKGATTDSARVAFLLALYQRLTSLLPAINDSRARRNRLPRYK